ncbi:NAD(P)/FAD-dependent oxidoreductase [Pseudidiomarina sp. E22-M8]|uniref:NAD(P)/FAD-dependent oxidoreductase n=1 Tax=Pseudidiomarina sp. E22-M8 TaxID=3424768 RepID=UPI00403CC987
MQEQIVIVGGGAGGLELATMLGRKLGRSKQAKVTLIDRNSTHLWKPLLHEVASGALDSRLAELDYRGQSARAGFQFMIGTLESVNNHQKTIQLAAIRDAQGREVLAARSLSYDRLILAIGGVTADFGTPGVKEHSYFLDSLRQADEFHEHLLNEFLRVDQSIEDGNETTLSLAIVGGGATGVELAAELIHSVSLLSIYGLSYLDQKHFKVCLVEAGERLLPALPERLSTSVEKKLKSLGVEVILDNPVTQVQENTLVLSEGKPVQANLIVWAAGVRAPDVTKGWGLKIRKNNQIEVNDYLQSVSDTSIYAIGDCAACRIDDERWVPPRAQSAHQMAECLYRNIVRGYRQQPAKPFVYKDRGSLVSLSRFSAVGNLMQSKSLSMSVEGTMARWAYASLYRMHQRALHGWWKMFLLLMVDRLNHVVKPRLKLH